MIVVKIQGGLGNQLFQFALALSLKAINHEQKIAIDKTVYKTNNKKITDRENLIYAFNIEDFSEATLKDFERKNAFFKMIDYLFNKNNCSIINESSKTLIPSVLNCEPNTYLNGYWQSYKYFEKITSEIKKQFSLKNTLTTNSLKQKEIILAKPLSIGVHIRRGDYISKYANIYAHLSLDYYYKGINHIKKKLNKENVSVFVFSDEIEWCKQNFKSTDDVFFIDDKANKPDYEDLFLMSYCGHNIIANSSYSWWAAWINSNADKIIVAPNNWYRVQEPQFNERIYPPTWTVL